MANELKDSAVDAANQPQTENVDKNEKDELQPVAPQPDGGIEFKFEDASEEDTFAFPLEEGVRVNFANAKMQIGKRMQKGVQIGSTFPTVCAGGFRFPLKAVASIIKCKGNSKADIEAALRELGIRKLSEYVASKYEDNKRVKPAYWRWSDMLEEAEQA
jgi:hypothetical protein